MTPLEEAAFPYGWFAQVHHWPPTVVDEQPWWVVEQLPVIAAAYAEVEETRMERAQAESQRAAR